MQALNQKLVKQHILLSLLCVGSTLIVGFVDYATKMQYTFGFFYLVPIVLATWALGRWYGYGVAAMAVIFWVCNDIQLAKYSPWTFEMFALLIARATLFYATVYLLATQIDFKLMLKHEQDASRRDVLTGVNNRRAFFELAEEYLKQARRLRLTFTVAFIDLDNFKYMNDTFGHDTGDEVLKAVAWAMRGATRNFDIVARLSGDEFVALFPGLDSKTAEGAVRRFQQSLLMEMKRREWPVTFSIGAVTFQKLPDSADHMVALADELMYSVKRSGKNTVNFRVHTGGAQDA